MADEAPEVAPDGVADESVTDDSLGDAGKAALEAERRARRDAEKAAKDLQRRLKALEDAGKSDDERRAEALSNLERERDSALLELARTRAAVKYGLTEEDLEFLVGSPDEIDERAEKLANRLGRAGKPAPKPKPDPSQGARSGGTSDPNANALGVLGF